MKTLNPINKVCVVYGVGKAEVKECEKECREESEKESVHA